MFPPRSGRSPSSGCCSGGVVPGQHSFTDCLFVLHEIWSFERKHILQNISCSPHIRVREICNRKAAPENETWNFLFQLLLIPTFAFSCASTHGESSQSEYDSAPQQRRLLWRGNGIDKWEWGEEWMMRGGVYFFQMLPVGDWDPGLLQNHFWILGSRSSHRSPLCLALPPWEENMQVTILNVFFTTCKAQQMLQDQAAWVWRLREGRSRLPGGMDARIVLPTIQVGHSRGAEGRRRGRGGREGGGEVSELVH